MSILGYWLHEWCSGKWNPWYGYIKHNQIVFTHFRGDSQIHCFTLLPINIHWILCLVCLFICSLLGWWIGLINYVPFISILTFLSFAQSIAFVQSTVMLAVMFFFLLLSFFFQYILNGYPYFHETHSATLNKLLCFGQRVKGQGDNSEIRIIDVGECRVWSFS